MFFTLAIKLFSGQGVRPLNIKNILNFLVDSVLSSVVKWFEVSVKKGNLCESNDFTC